MRVIFLGIRSLNLTLSAIIADFFESLFVNKQDISNASRAFSKDLTHSFGDRVSLNPPLQPFRLVSIENVSSSC